MYAVTNEEIQRLVPAVNYSEALSITATEGEVRAACETAKRYRFRAAVAFPQYLGILVDELKGSSVRAQNISLIRDTVGDRIGIKASGHVASLKDGVALMHAGATVVALRRFLVDQLESLGWRRVTD